MQLFCRDWLSNVNTLNIMDKNSNEKLAATSKVSIRIVPNGPALVQGGVEIVDQLGNREEKTSMFALCRCGASHRKPYCDGTHNYNGFSDEVK